MLDEAANTAPIRNLPQIAATAAGQGIQVVTVFQDLAQARSRYGEAADTILANHRAKLFLSGISDARTLDYLGRALGDEEVGYESHTEASGAARAAPAAPARSAWRRPTSFAGSLRARRSSSTATCRRRGFACAPGTGSRTAPASQRLAEGAA